MKNSLLFILAFLIISCSDKTELISQVSNEIDKSHFNYISQVKLPETLELCGEQIPLDDYEVRERAEREFYLLLQQPGQIMLYLKRSGRYFPTYEKVIRMNNMPDDLKYLSVAESALYQATSTAGAIGLWQFMASTGKAMGLQIDDYVDERRHPEKSTMAAMKYLKQGYEQHGSWLLTLAGYNMGHTGVANNVDFQNAEDYFDLYLNSETSRFIFRIALIKEFMQHPEKYGFNITKEDKYRDPETKIIKVNSAISDLSKWAIENGTTYKYVKLLNPWILKRELPNPKSGSWEILVPVK